MATYTEIMDAINSFLVNINKLRPLSPDLFQGVFMKKLSNSNLVLYKKYADASSGKKTHQSHLDLTGQETLKFFFGDNPVDNNDYSQIMLDIPVDNLKLLKALDNPEEHTEQRGHPTKDVIVLRRKPQADFSFHHTSDLFYYAYAFKKLEGHSGDQNQINRLNNKDEFFALCSCAYEGDFLIFMKHSLNHYICVLIPAEYAGTISDLMGSSVNFPVTNPHYDKETALSEFCSIMERNVEQEFSDIETAIQSDSNTLNGYDKEQLTKVRVGQGSFRKLLIEQRGCTCQLCSINFPEVLRASHIQRWADSSPEERLDLQNGLLLCANHDVLFDRHLITFDVNTEELLISPSIPEEQFEELKLNNPKKIHFSDRMKAYMKKHNDLFEK